MKTFFFFFFRDHHDFRTKLVFVWETQTIFLSYPKCTLKSWFGQTSQNLGKTSLPPQNFLGWYGYDCACNNVYRLATVSYFAITFLIRTSKRNTLMANKIELNWIHNIDRPEKKILFNSMWYETHGKNTTLVCFLAGWKKVSFPENSICCRIENWGEKKVWIRRWHQ